MSKTLNLIHVVFGTHCRHSTLNPENKEQLHKMICDFLNKTGCRLIRINSMPDHVHILMNLSPAISLSEVIGKLKANMSLWIKRSGLFPLFEGWCEGYFACSVSPQNSESVISYIINQEHHHASRSYHDEMNGLYLKAGLQWHDNELNN